MTNYSFTALNICFVVANLLGAYKWPCTKLYILNCVVCRFAHKNCRFAQTNFVVHHERYFMLEYFNDGKQVCVKSDLQSHVFEFFDVQHNIIEICLTVVVPR